MIEFSKMQAQGNDFVILEPGDQEPVQDLAGLAIAICDRRYGVGADGLVLLRDTADADAEMIIYNSDGSRAAMCGSALRCCGWLLARKTHKRQVLIATGAGIKSVETDPESGVVHANLGMPEILEEELELDEVRGSIVSTGNLHFVSWWDDLSNDPHLVHGGRIEHSPGWGKGLNSMYAKVISPNQIQLKIWENACGPTLACGTGATATVKTGYEQGILKGKVKVMMPGGEVEIWQDNGGDLILSGKVTEVFGGSYKWKI